MFVEHNLNIARVASVGKLERCAVANTIAPNSYVDEQTQKETSLPAQPNGIIFSLSTHLTVLIICTLFY